VRKANKSMSYNLTGINLMLLYSLFAVAKNQINDLDRVAPRYLPLLGFSAPGGKILLCIRFFLNGNFVGRPKSD